MESANGETTAPAVRTSSHVARQGSSTWVVRPRKLIIGGAVVVGAAAFALSQQWLAAVDLVPLLYALPCAAMMLMCMRGMNGGHETNTAQADDRSEAPATSDTRK